MGALNLGVAPWHRAHFWLRIGATSQGMPVAITPASGAGLKTTGGPLFTPIGGALNGGGPASNPNTGGKLLSLPPPNAVCVEERSEPCGSSHAASVRSAAQNEVRAHLYISSVSEPTRVGRRYGAVDG